MDKFEKAMQWVKYKDQSIYYIIKNKIDEYEHIIKRNEEQLGMLKEITGCESIYKALSEVNNLKNNQKVEQKC